MQVDSVKEAWAPTQASPLLLLTNEEKGKDASLAYG